MGRIYCGPYAAQLGYDHEGYAARVLPDGTVTASWTAETADLIACVAACTCGWTGESHHAADDVGEDDAVDDWERLHLARLVEGVARDGWQAWAERTAARSAEVAAHVAAGRIAFAAEVLGRLLADARIWADTLDRLAQDSTDTGGRR